MRLASMSYFRSNLKEQVVLDIANGVSVGGHFVVLDCENVARGCCLTLLEELRRKGLCHGPTIQMT